ncbi:MAG: LacI family transcriptional regulator [Armatimonadetes bacterium]|nr:LacI family transcriptional regulator [Armatimonadota bacterium]
MNIKQFAEKTGVSPTTVSHTISGQGRVSPATRKMIKDKIEELGFVPNLNARRLVSGRSYLIAIGHISDENLADLFTIQVAQSVLEQLNQRGYDLLICHIGSDKQGYALMQQRVKSRSVDGTIILGAGMLPHEFVENLARPYHPCIMVDEEWDGVEAIPHVGHVGINLQPGAKQVAELLVENGHTRIGFIDETFDDLLMRIFREELNKLGVELPDNLVARTGNNAEHGAESIRRLLSGSNPPTAIFARSDVLALGALREAKRMGYRVPADLSIVGHDDWPMVVLADPELTTVHIDTDRLGKAAVEMLFSLINEPELVVESQAVDTCLVVRGTVAAAPSA